jgi:drug/metabolite transporter (DMT)-like permease
MRGTIQAARPVVPASPRFSWRYALGVALRVFAAAVVAGYPISASNALDHALSVPDMLLLRFGIAAILLLPYTAWSFGQLTATDWKVGIGLGCLHGLLMSSIALGGLAHAPAAHAVLLGPPTVGFWAFLLGVIFFRYPVAPRRWAGIAILFVGISCLFFSRTALEQPLPGTRQWLGDLMFLAAGAIGGLSSLLVQRAERAPLRLAAIMALTGGIGAAIIWALSGPSALFQLPPQRLIGYALYHGLAVGTLVTIAVYYSVAFCGAGRAGMFDALIPALGVLFAALIAPETVGHLEILALVFMLGGIGVAAAGSGQANRG